MKMRFVLVGLISLFAVSVATTQTSTVEVKTSGEKVSVNFKNAPIFEVLTALIKARPGANYILKPGVDGKVNLTLVDQDWETVLKYAMEQVGARHRKDENGVYIIEPDMKLPRAGSLLSQGAVTIKQGEVQRYEIAGGWFDPHNPHHRLIITLYSLKGDADLFVGFEADVSPTKFTYKSVNGPLQADQVIIPIDDSQYVRPTYIAVYGVIDSEYVLARTSVANDIATVPAQPRVLKVTSQAIAGSYNLLVTGLTIENLTAAWYEVTVTKEGKVLEKSGIPAHLILGPKQRRYYGYVALDDASKLTFHLDRNTTKARAYLVADLVVRLVNAGKPLAPDIGDSMEDLIPRLSALAPAGLKFQRSDWRGGGEELLRVIKQRPDVLYALQQVLSRSGVNISTVLLAKRIGTGFGALSATMGAMAASKAPAEEKVEVTLK